MVLENELVSLTKGNSILIPSYTRHDFYVNSGGGVKIVQLEFRIEKQVSHTSGISSKSVLPFLNSLQKNSMSFVRIPQNPEIGDCMERIIRENRMKLTDFEALNKLYFWELAILLSRNIDKMLKLPGGIENKCLKQAVELIHKGYCSGIKVKNVADECGVSERYVRKLFEKHLGSTPQEYCNNFKITKAVELLSTRGITIKDIAYSAGYSTPQYFCRVFKKAYGFTPQKYRDILFGNH